MPRPIDDEPITLQPRQSLRTTAGKALPWLIVPWGIGCVLVSDRLLGALGYTLKTQPEGARLFLLIVAFAPIWLWIATPWLGRIAGFRWLLVWPQPGGSVDHDGIELRMADDHIVRVSWDDVDRLRLRSSWRESWGELVGRDGSVLVRVPDYLIHLKPTWREAPTLAEVVVSTRPDLFVLTASPWRLGGDTFARPGPDARAVDGADFRRRRRRVVWAVMVGGLLVGVLGSAILFLRTNP